MNHIFRYISVVTAQENKAAAATDAECGSGNCNYSNNYYGDQVCDTRTSAR